MNLSQYRTAIREILGDLSATRWTNNQIDQALRIALGEYTAAYPQQADHIITLTETGREIDLSSLTWLSNVIQVCYPYDATETEQPVIEDWYLYFPAGQPYLHIGPAASEPQSGEVIQVYYTMPQTIETLDGGASTTVRADHESYLVMGAAGHSLNMRANALTESYGRRTPQDQAFDSGKSYLLTWSKFLKSLSMQFSLPRPVTGWPGVGWKLDDWDTKS